MHAHLCPFVCTHVCMYVCAGVKVHHQHHSKGICYLNHSLIIQIFPQYCTKLINMGLHLCVCMCVCACVHIHRYMYVFVCVCMYVCMCIWECLCVCRSTQVMFCSPHLSDNSCLMTGHSNPRVCTTSPT